MSDKMDNEMPKEIFMHYTQDYHVENAAQLEGMIENFTRYTKTDWLRSRIEAMKIGYVMNDRDEWHNAALDQILKLLENDNG